MKITANTQHLLERANRALSHHRRSSATRALGENDIERWVETIRARSPEDWRFSENPLGDFQLTVVTDGLQLKILGRSYRLTRRWRTIRDGVITLAGSSAPDETVIHELAQLYLQEQCQADAEICHDLKTILAPHMMPQSGGEIEFENGESHMAVLSGNRVEHNLARRPNSILIDRSGFVSELLVRQGRPYIRAFAGADRSISFCVFAKLSPEGIEPGSGQLWKISGSGVAYESGLAQCWPMPKPDKASVPDGFRTDSYWQLPLQLDAWCQDLRFRVAKDELPESDVNCRRLRTMERVRETASRLCLPALGAAPVGAC